MASCLPYEIQCAELAAERKSNKVRIQMRSGLASLTSISATAAFFGFLGTVIGILNSFHSITGPNSGIMADIAKRVSDAMVPGFVGFSVALMAFWFYRYLNGRMQMFDLEMKAATVDLVNMLARFGMVEGAFTDGSANVPGLSNPFSNPRMFPNVLQELIWPQLRADLTASRWVCFVYGVIGFLAYWNDHRLFSGLMLFCFFGYAGWLIKRQPVASAVAVFVFFAAAVGLCVLSPFDLGMAEFFLALAPLLLLGSLRAAGLVCKTEKYVLVMRRLVLAGLCAGACAVFSVGTIFGLYQTLSNESEMYPTIRGGDWIIGWISAPTSPIFRGELLQVGCAGRRVVGLPGDQILIEGGTLIRNGKAVREQYKQTFTNPLADFPVPSELDADARRLWVREMPADKQGEKAFIVPEGHYFILNDNRNQPRDSRTDGTFVRGEFGGRLLLALSPVRRSVVFLQ